MNLMKTALLGSIALVCLSSHALEIRRAEPMIVIAKKPANTQPLALHKAEAITVVGRRDAHSAMLATRTASAPRRGA